MVARVKPQLAVLRAKHGRITQAELARRTGISQKQLSALERGKTRGIDFSTMERLCDFFLCTPNELLFVELQRPPTRTRAQALVDASLARAMAEPAAPPETIWAEFDEAVARMRQARAARGKGRS